jgi:hypothetical protein
MLMAKASTIIQKLQMSISTMVNAREVLNRTRNLTNMDNIKQVQDQITKPKAPVWAQSKSDHAAGLGDPWMFTYENQVNTFMSNTSNLEEKQVQIQDIAAMDNTGHDQNLYANAPQSNNTAPTEEYVQSTSKETVDKNVEQKLGNNPDLENKTTKSKETKIDFGVEPSPTKGPSSVETVTKQGEVPNYQPNTETKIDKGSLPENSSQKTDEKKVDFGVEPIAAVDASQIETVSKNVEVANDQPNTVTKNNEDAQKEETSYKTTETKIDFGVDPTASVHTSPEESVTKHVEVPNDQPNTATKNDDDAQKEETTYKTTETKIDFGVDPATSVHTSQEESATKHVEVPIENQPNGETHTVKNIETDLDETKKTHNVDSANEINFKRESHVIGIPNFSAESAFPQNMMDPPVPPVVDNDIKTYQEHNNLDFDQDKISSWDHLSKNALE